MIEKMDNSNIGKLLIRVHSGKSVGLGHLMRCLSLAEAWCEHGGSVSFASEFVPKNLLPRASFNEIDWIEVEEFGESGRELSEIAERIAADLIVIDGYKFDPGYMQWAGKRGHPILVVDDDARHHSYPVDILLNQNVYGSADIYSGKTNAKLLLGPKFALLRKEFREWRNWERKYPATASKFLITLGGSDSENSTFKVVQAFLNFQKLHAEYDIEMRVILGPINPHIASLKAFTSKQKHIKLFIDVKDIGEHMRWCDIALSASGSTTLELALFQTPMVIGAATWSEERVANAIEAMSAAKFIGRFSDVKERQLICVIYELLNNSILRKSFGVAAGDIVDGLGTNRVIKSLLAFRD